MRNDISKTTYLNNSLSHPHLKLGTKYVFSISITVISIFYKTDPYFLLTSHVNYKYTLM